MLLCLPLFSCHELPRFLFCRTAVGRLLPVPKTDAPANPKPDSNTDSSARKLAVFAQQWIFRNGVVEKNAVQLKSSTFTDLKSWNVTFMWTASSFPTSRKHFRGI